MDLYSEGNAENARDLYPDMDLNQGILQAENDFYTYLREVLFATPGAMYAVWEEEGVYISALRLEPYRDGLLLEALETHPDYRKQGYAKKLLLATLTLLTDMEATVVYSHIHKGNVPSLKTHLSCGFERISEQAVYIDGSVTNRCCTMQRLLPSAGKQEDSHL